MRIAVLCATDRGLRALKCLRAMAPDADFMVVTYPETVHEPPFVESIRTFAKEKGCAFFLQTDISKPPALEFFLDSVDLLFCFSWRYMVPSEIFKSTRLGSYVIHDSLLPKYRGFSPAIWALMNGEKEVGVTLFEMAEEVDSGRIVGQKPIPVSPKDDIGTIREKGTEAMLELLQRCFPSLVSGEPILSEQDETAATYCCKWTPADARLNWENDAESILNLIRAVTYPYPGAFCFRERDKITIWSASPPTATRVYASHAPGALTFRANDGSIGVLTGKGEIVLRELSLNDGPRLPAGDILKSLSTRLY